LQVAVGAYAAPVTLSATVSLVKRARLMCEDGNFAKAKELVEQALSLDPENGEAYLVALMAEYQRRTEGLLGKLVMTDLSQKGNYWKAIRFGDEALKERLKGYDTQAKANYAEIQRKKAEEEEARRKALEEKWRQQQLAKQERERQQQLAKQERERQDRKAAKRAWLFLMGFVVVTVAVLVVVLGIKPAMDRAALEAALEAAPEADPVAPENASVGDRVHFGDIDWRVLDVQDGRVLLISWDILEQRAYNNEQADVTWETCSLRAYLNSEFLAAHFSEDEQGRIALSTIINDDNPEYGTPGGNDTEDKVFLLSINEVTGYLISDSDREAKYQGSGHWWCLRSPGVDASSAADVDVVGGVSADARVDNDYAGIRPALWLNLKPDESSTE
jgi:tetratricopeptide (TPR) repeat protein